MRVDGGRVQTLHVVKSDRRIDHETKDTRTDQVPERDGYEEVDRVTVLREPLSRASATIVFHRFVTHKRQRHDLECAENRTERKSDRRRACEVEMMQCPDDAAREIYRGREKRSFSRTLHIDHLQTGEQERDHDRGEYFEEALHPEMDHPPTPVFDHCQLRVLTPEKGWCVEECDAGGGDE